MALSRSHRRDEVNFWPGFVDALSTMLIGIVFLLSVFVLGQFFLSQELTGKDTALDRLNRQISELTDLLALERSSNRQAQENLQLLQSSLTREQSERGRIQDLLNAQPGNQAAQLGEAQKALEAEKQLSARAQAADSGHAPAARRAGGGARRLRGEGQGSPGPHLRTRLAPQCRAGPARPGAGPLPLRLLRPPAPGARHEARHPRRRRPLRLPVGGVLKPEGRGELDKLGAIIADLGREMPPDLPWILRVDGHTDNRPIRSPQFPSNWHLSAARAIAVVEYLVTKGISADRIAATGFGEFQPLDVANTDDAWRRNRRIEFKITER